MNDLVQLKNDEAVCSSLDVAEKFGKRHQEVLYAIEGRECSCNGNGCKKCHDRGYQQLGILSGDMEITTKSHLSKMFVKSTYKDEGNRTRPMYLMNRDGFSLLVMGFTGKSALEWKLKYIEAFNKMESIIREKSTQMWISAREAGKLTRKSETDVIKELIEYAKSQGSSHSDKLYIVYSNLANKMAGVKNRDEASVQQLGRLDMAEQIILCMIREGMAVGLGYKEIYQNCKERLELVKELAYLGVS